jgi:predicted nucleic acid-binding protein
MNFFDSNVLVYVLDAGAPSKRAMAERLVADELMRGELVISTQVLQESFNVLTRKLKLPAEDVLAFLRPFSRARVVPSDAAFVMRALQRSADENLSTWDALIVEAAVEAGCRRLYTEDFQAGRRFGPLEVVNPFSPGVHEPRPAYARSRGRPRSGVAATSR